MKELLSFTFYSSDMFRISPGRHFKILHKLSRVSNRIPFTFPVFNKDRFVMDIPTFSESSVSEILFFAISTSRFMMIAIR